MGEWVDEWMQLMDKLSKQINNPTIKQIDSSWE